jgi:hypothetical protein
VGRRGIDFSLWNTIVLPAKKAHIGRFFKAPDEQDLKLVGEAETRWATLRPHFTPMDKIPSGDETNRLHRWGYQFYYEMFNACQLLGLEPASTKAGHRPGTSLQRRFQVCHSGAGRTPP